MNQNYIVLKIVNQARFFTNYDYKISTRILYVRIKYCMYDLICDVISCCVRSCDMGKSNVFDKILMKKKEKRKKSKKFVHKSQSKRRFWNVIYSLLLRAESRGSANTIYCM